MIRHALVLSVLAAPAAAQQVLPCDNAPAESIAEPWEANTASYAEGQVRIAVLDMVEPAGGALKLLVISPPRDEVGYRQCRVIQSDRGIGFYDLDFAKRRASYDPQKGLTLTMPAQHYLPGNPEAGWFQLSLSINQQTGDITVQDQP
ncbi:hypothetical protein [Paracoccus benzoatiresistens]|uniref:DUF2141 domain-containing protein n=1 Tax=Paracoccus benzoatiresistens TaxID=2997341 RepID=A0ABT4J6T2_9RHOB|nr:hypothetical protein [Paracoccus sp. EF6]MCZ0962792.1 hypothetical protein [Paracoccus sp. EF6]